MKAVWKRFFSALVLALLFSMTVPAVVPGTINTVEAAKVKISSSKITLAKGASKKLKVTGTSSKVTWSSNKKSVATVSKSGKVTAKGKGTATITARVGSKKYTCKVTVETPKISMTSVNLTKNGTVYLKMSGTKQKVKWKSSKKSVATVSSSGLVKAKKAGTTKITATVSGKTYTCTVKVVSGTISVKEKNITLAVGERKTITVDFTAKGDISVAADTSVVRGEFAENWCGSTIDITLIGVGAGTTNFVIQSTKTSAKQTINVTVTGNNNSGSGDNSGSSDSNGADTTIAVSGISLSDTYISIEDGNSYTLTASVTPSNATDATVSWSSSNTDVAKVSSSGVVTAESVGETIITATAGDKTATCVVKVYVPVTFNLPETPVIINTYSSSGSLLGICTVTGLRYTVKKSGDSYYYQIYADGIRNYYYKGSSISAACKIGFKIYNSAGAVVDSGTIYSPAVCEGEQFAESYTNGFIAAGDYTIEILDVC